MSAGTTTLDAVPDAARLVALSSAACSASGVVERAGRIVLGHLARVEAAEIALLALGVDHDDAGRSSAPRRASWSTSARVRPAQQLLDAALHDACARCADRRPRAASRARRVAPSSRARAQCRRAGAARPRCSSRRAPTPSCGRPRASWQSRTAGTRRSRPPGSAPRRTAGRT